MSYRDAAQALAATVQNTCPGSTPPWLTWGLGGLSAVAIGFDIWTARQLSKKDPEPSLHQQMADIYYQKAAQLSGGKAPAPLNLTVNIGGAPAQTSRYLMEEGNTNTATDCFACASSHLATTKKAVEMAQENMQDGKCGDRCRAWLNTGAQETASLLAKDWTDERLAAQPEHKRQVLEKYRSDARGVMADMLGGNEQAALINEAAGLLDESLRFINAGDPLDHPEVDSRLRDAEAALSAAERVDIMTWDTGTANKIRGVRQAVGSKVNTPEDLKQVRSQARDLANSINQQVFSDMSAERITDLNKRTSSIYNGFKRDRQSVERKAG